MCAHACVCECLLHRKEFSVPHDSLVRKSRDPPPPPTTEEHTHTPTHTHTPSWSVSHDDCMSGTLSSICSLSMVITHARTDVHAHVPSSAAQGHSSGRLLCCDLYSTSHTQTHTHTRTHTVLRAALWLTYNMPVSPLPHSCTLSESCYTIQLTVPLQLRGNASQMCSHLSLVQILVYIFKKLTGCLDSFNHLNQK